MWHDSGVTLARLLRLPLALAIGLGVAAPAEAQLWKPDKKKPATSIKAKKKPTKRKVSKPTKRKPKAAKRAPKRSAPETPDEDDSPVITILPGDDD